MPDTVLTAKEGARVALDCLGLITREVPDAGQGDPKREGQGPCTVSPGLRAGRQDRHGADFHRSR